MILELDLGNTQCKWRMLDQDGRVVGRGVDAIEDWLTGNFPRSWGVAIGRVRIASVLADAIEQLLAERLQARLQVPLEWARSAEYCAGVRNVYAEPARLGVDRWLALIAAYNRYRGPALVIDIGSALTADLVDGTGAHRGGYIIPGPRLMGEALLRSTDRVRFEQGSAFDSVDPGRDTAACVHNGIALAATGAVLLARARAETLLGVPVTACIGGGYAPALIKNLAEADARDWPLYTEMVMDGLRWALP